MATNYKAAETPKDTQIKPIVQSTEQVIEQTAGPPENSPYFTEDKSLMNLKNNSLRFSLFNSSEFANKEKENDNSN